MPEQRLRYRTVTDLLSVVLLDMEGRKTPGRVLDVSAGGVGAFVLRRRDPEFEIGKVVWACITSQLISHRVVSSALVRRIEDCGMGRLYGLEFLEAARLVGKMPPPLAAVFNRRHAERLRISPERPVDIILGGAPSSPDLGGVKGSLRDISLGGLAFRLEAGAAGEIASTPSREILLTVPGQRETVALTIRIGHSRRGVDGLYCGAAFDPARTKRFDEKRRSLIALLTRAGLIPGETESLLLPDVRPAGDTAFSEAC